MIAAIRVSRGNRFDSATIWDPVFSTPFFLSFTSGGHGTSSDFPSKRRRDAIVHGEDDGPLMVAKIIQDGESTRWMYLWRVEPPALLPAFEPGLRDEVPT